MNMMLLDEADLRDGMPAGDRRAQHILRILKKQPGDTLLAGLVNKASGSATFERQEGGRLFFSFVPADSPEALPPITLLLGFPRPIQAGRIFKDLTSLGVRRIILTGTELGEKSYIESNFFKHDEYRAALMEGAEQAANPLLPEVQKEWTLPRALKLLNVLDTGPTTPTNQSTDVELYLTAAGSTGNGQRWLLHPDPNAPRFGEICRNWKMNAEQHGSRGEGQTPDGYRTGSGRDLTLAVGSERGWTAAELAMLTEYGFATASLGRRILKSETACLAAVSLALGGLGLL